MKTAFTALARAFWKDEHGFIVSAELVLVGTITVLSMIVGLTSVSRAINSELSDIAEAFGAVNQDDGYSGGRHRGGNRYASGDDAGIVRR
jgi:Flp pilus assembly pilin Flp